MAHIGLEVLDTLKALSMVQSCENVAYKYLRKECVDKELVGLPDIYANYMMKCYFGTENIIKLGVVPKVLDTVINKGFLNPETLEYDLSNLNSDNDRKLLLDFYMGTLMNKYYSEETLMNYIIEQELPEEFKDVILSKLVKEKNPTFKLGEKYFHIHTTEYNQAVISYLGENYVPEEDDYCIELSE